MRCIITGHELPVTYRREDKPDVRAWGVMTTGNLELILLISVRVLL